MPLVNFQQFGDGDHIILIHGLLGSLENLNMVAKGLSEKYKVTSIDVRNHGNSFHEANMDYPTLAQDVIDLMAHLNIPKAHILGHSMGGKIAMTAALLHPEKVEKLLVADIAPIQYPPHHQQILAGLQSLKLEVLKNRKEADQALAEYVELPSTRQFLLKNLQTRDGKLSFKCNLANIQSCYEQIMQGQNYSQAFEGKTLFIKGGDSDYIKAEHREKINQLFPQAQAKIISGAGHWLHAEKTSIFNKIVRDFLAA